MASPIKLFDDQTMEIKRVYTPPSERGKGIATLLLSELENWADEMSFKRCILETGKMQPEAIAKLAKAMSFKAPIAMDVSEELIDAAQGPKSELDKLEAIFNSKDALLGLTSIGKRVVYSGE